MPSSRCRLALLLVAVALAGCTSPSRGAAPDDAADGGAPAPRVIQAGAPGEPGRLLSEEEVAAISTPAHTGADVAFMQGMLHHHAQALEMAALAEERSPSDDVKLFAERVDLSQEGEIALIGQWLAERGERVPDVAGHGHGSHGAEPMPGMLTPDEMDQLRSARGEAFDVLFLTLMTQHHEGALQMVAELLGRDDGSAAEPRVFQFAADVDADQRIEIERMARMLAERESARR